MRREEGRSEEGGGVSLITRTPYLGHGNNIVAFAPLPPAKQTYLKEIRGLSETPTNSITLLRSHRFLQPNKTVYMS